MLREYKTAVIHQPDFLPYLGFFHRLLHADLYVILDCVQFVGSSRSWHRRDKIKTSQGEKWITVGVKKAPRDTKINEIYLDCEHDWRAQNLNLIRENYKKASFFEEIFPRLEELYSFKCEKMIDFNLESIHMLMKFFDIKIDEIVAGTLKPVGTKNELLVDILSKAEAVNYLSGVGAKDYFQPEAFEKAGIKVLWQDFKHPVYPQLHGEFIPFLSSIDLLFNCGVEKSREILRGI